MSDARESEAGGLEPLPDLPDHEPLAELPPDVPARAPMEVPAPGAPAAGARGPSKPRELERAPIVLRKAALILAIASLFPWLQPGGWTLHGILAKLIVALGGYVFYTAVLHRHGDAVPGPLAKLGGLHRLALDLLAVVIALVGLFFTMGEPLRFGPIVERASLAVGLAAWCQVLDYEKGGKFNPVLGLTIPLFGIAALARLITLFTAEFDVFTAIGDVGVLAASGIAGYTMFIAMKEAKAHGEAKKRAAQEARMAARKTRTAGEGAQPRPPPRAGGT
ncbi:MAG TPA: hypothetical protein VMS76_18645 [Planctomycetota bacterium]|nr:hypothetical protein [Planctomycetota bacterium]